MARQQKRVAIRVGNYRLAVHMDDWAAIKRLVDRAIAEPNKPARGVGEAGPLGAIAFDAAEERHIGASRSARR